MTTMVCFTAVALMALYCDSTINAKIFGNNAVSAVLVIYEYEEESRGGPQSAANLPFNFGQPMLSVFPSPVQKGISISYVLTKAVVVRLSLYDVTGRLVRDVVNEGQMAGPYDINLDMTNLAQGVYFIDLNAVDEQIAKKVIFLK